MIQMNSENMRGFAQSQSELSCSRNCPQALLNCVPGSYKRLCFSELKIGLSYRNKFIVGRIVYLSDMKPQQKKCHFRKCLLSDTFTGADNGGAHLSVFLFNDFASRSTSAEVEGYIAISNFEVEPLTLGTCKINNITVMPVQVLVKDDSGNNGTGIWIARKMIQPQQQLQDATQQSQESPTTSYTYVTLDKLCETRDYAENFNVYGIVEDCHIRIKQGHQVQTLDLVLCDPTTCRFPVSVFSVNDENFPDVHPGDVARVHRMAVESSRGKLKGKCYSPKFILVFSSKDKGADPKSVAKRFTFTAGDTNKAASLFEWDKKRKWKLISDVKLGENVNILCQVVSVLALNSSDSVLLSVWDGTKSTIIPTDHEIRASAVVDKKLISVAREYVAHIWANGCYAIAAAELKPGQFIEVLDVLLTHPKTGNTEKAAFCLRPPFKENKGITVIQDENNCLIELKRRLKVIMDEVPEHSTDPGGFQNQNILNCDISLPADQNKSRFRAFSPYSQVPTSEQEIRDEWWKKFSTISESLGHSDIKPSTVHQVLVHSVPYKFRVFAIVLNYQPESQYIGDLIRLYCPECHYLTRNSTPDIQIQGYRNGIANYFCPRCSINSNYGRNGSLVELRYTYLVSFSLHDGSQSGTLDVYLWQDDAVKFFRGITPEAALSNSFEADNVFKTIWAVCPNADPNRGSKNIADIMNKILYPTLDCCIMSYTAGGVTRYRMFDTVLKN